MEETAPLTIRKVVTLAEEIWRDGGVAVQERGRRIVAGLVVENPYAGRFESDLSPLVDEGERLGDLLAQAALELAGGRRVESYGKAGIAGMAGEIEHVAAILHPKFGAPLREAVGGGKAIIPSTKKRGGPGTRIDIPLHHKDAAFVRSHFDGIEFGVTDAPADNELVIAIALATTGRPHARIGGLQQAEIQGEDGLR
jgi:Amino acid synthesis